MAGECDVADAWSLGFGEDVDGDILCLWVCMCMYECMHAISTYACTEAICMYADTNVCICGVSCCLCDVVSLFRCRIYTAKKITARANTKDTHKQNTYIHTCMRVHSQKICK